MNHEILEFVFSFLVGLLFYRILLAIIPHYFKKPFTRTTLKLRWHHLHGGIALIFLATFLLLFFGESDLETMLLGLGLGLSIDLFIPSLEMKTNRKQEMKVYRSSLRPTLILGTLIVMVISAFALLR